MWGDNQSIFIGVDDLCMYPSCGSPVPMIDGIDGKSIATWMTVESS